MDTKALKLNYPQKSWRKAYDDIRSFLEKNGFMHEQGSGYHSKEPMSRFEAIGVIDKMLETHPWLNECVRVCTIANVPEQFDISHMFVKKTDILLN
ncbi:MAG: hypothetical protein FWH05_09040 [Oscillospiraceae bacterium]|nr:hypothetical protein [Oscillospiraceae bacterium]